MLSTQILNFLKHKNFKKQLKQFRSKNDGRFTVAREDLFPCLNDDKNFTPFDSHYIYHPAWATRIIKTINPEEHVDISSTLHFCTMLSAFFKTRFYDYRPAKVTLSNLTSEKIDLTSMFLKSNSVQSISCMHTIEHIGLGRYGDPIDPTGDIKAINELKRVVDFGGNLLLVVPVGQPKIQFNAHRVYSYEMILNLMDGFELKEFSMVDDQNIFIENASFELVANQKYGCGCFWFTKNK
jgi:hypothetical protein